MGFMENLIALRKKKRLSQQELAEALDVSRQAVSRWEVGASMPSMENLLALSKLFDVPVHELVGGAGPAETSGPELEVHVEKAKLARYQLLTRVPSMALTVVVVIGLLAVLHWSQNKFSPSEQNILDIENLEGERIDDSNAVENLPIS